LALSEHVFVTAWIVQGAFPLFYAVALKSISIVDEMLRRGARDQVNVGFNAQYPLHIAAQAQDKEIVKMLLQHVKDVDVKGPGNRTALHVACAYPNADVAAVLLTHGECMWWWCWWWMYKLEVFCLDSFIYFSLSIFFYFFLFICRSR
jgi:hypothetical protein